MYTRLLALLPIASAIASSPPILLEFDLSHHVTAAAQDTQIPLFTEYSFPQHVKPTLALKAVPTTVYRPSSYDALEHARWRSVHQAQSEPVTWIETHVLGPDITDRRTLAQLARMAANAYQLPSSDNWYNIDPSSWNVNGSFPFGWGENEDGLRGFIFRSRDNATLVLSIKGTTLFGPTSSQDKFNDNLLFSCCCAHVDFSWVFSTVCDCSTWSGFQRQCDDPCLSDALRQDSLFYSVGIKLIRDLRLLFPHANLWLVGHSLGGSLAALLGATFGLPVVAFEAPGERMAAHRLHLPLPPSLRGLDLPDVPITHVYHTADPIPQGACTGLLSLCARGGYALETRCHLGRSIVYDTVTRLGWYVDVRTHPIKILVLKVLDLEGLWPDVQDGAEREVPTAREEVDCVDCFKWEFGHFKHAKNTTTLPHGL